MKRISMKNARTRKIVMTGMLAAVSTVLMMLSFSVPLMPSFIKMDFSELPALIAAFSMGPLSGVAVCLIKNLFNLFFTTTGGVGELANFLLGVSFVLPAGVLYRIRHDRRTAFWAAMGGALLMGLFSLPLNYFLTYPVYSSFLPLEAIIGMYQAILPGVDGLLMCLLVFNVPYTFLKGVIVTLLTFLVYKHISPLIKGART